ncbi:MAG: thioredoxin family protein, partial [Rhodocyclaceae bacterium]|nr:thioredoxin family protein [Rhodocyclaceae bacterium]
MDYLCDVTEADFEQSVVARSHEVPVLVDIGAGWCGPCRVLTPLLERLAKQYAGGFVLANVDADENMKLAGRHKVRGFPTVIAYSRGVEIDRFHSAQ